MFDVPYSSVVLSMMYAMVCTHPDISCAVRGGSINLEA